jgi:protein tyrosine phosphatase (PTP) superfamily phosphohydrolase (DUF442 family)
MFKHTFLMFTFMAGVVVAEEHKTYLNDARLVGDNIWIGPQPEASDFDEFAAEEVSLVLNTRTAVEMEQLDFDQADKAGAYDMSYELLEIGKDHPYCPAKLAAFNDILQAHEGQKMVLHCRSGNRASQLYAAWLIKYQNKTPAEALKAIQSDETELSDAMKTLLGQ